jgi:hypothetical protein
MPKNFDQVTFDSPEDLKIAHVRVSVQRLPDLKGQAVHAPTHVGSPDRQPNPHTRGNRDHRRDRTLTTRASAAASTSAPTIIRSPLARTISIRPAAVEDAGETAGVGSAVMAAGTNVTTLPAPSAAIAPAWRRHVNSMLAFRSWRRATIDTEAPGAKVSATI